MEITNALAGLLDMVRAGPQAIVAARESWKVAARIRLRRFMRLRDIEGTPRIFSANDVGRNGGRALDQSVSASWRRGCAIPMRPRRELRKRTRHIQ